MKPSVLTLPQVDLPEFKRNFIKTAVCELRFPILLEIEKSPPTKLHSKLRKEFPHFERRASYDIATEVKENAYVFSSQDKKWVLSVKPAAIALETSTYTSFTDFNNLMRKILAAAVDFIDSDFYIRIGLRYIDLIPHGDDIDGWLNNDIIAPLATGKFGLLENHWHVLRGMSPTGKYTFQYGVRNPEKKEYTLDFDFFTEGVELKDAGEVIQKLHKESLSLFKWSLGKKSIDYLTGKK